MSIFEIIGSIPDIFVIFFAHPFALWTLGGVQFLYSVFMVFFVVSVPCFLRFIFRKEK